MITLRFKEYQVILEIAKYCRVVITNSAYTSSSFILSCLQWSEQKEAASSATIIYRNMSSRYRCNQIYPYRAITCSFILLDLCDHAWGAWHDLQTGSQPISRVILAACQPRLEIGSWFVRKSTSSILKLIVFVSVFVMVVLLTSLSGGRVVFKFLRKFAALLDSERLN